MTLRIVATSDTHFPFSEDMIPDGDVFIHAGDLMYSGYESEWYPRLESLKSLTHKVKLYVPGNHDFHVERYEGIARAELRKQAGVRLIGMDYEPTLLTLANGMTLLGIPYITGLKGWAFNREEEWVLNYLRQLDRTPDIVVSHAPMYAVLDAILPEQKRFQNQEHVGCRAFNKWFNEIEEKPKVWINGHIHESYGRQKYGGCMFYNVAMCDRNYEQNNKPMVIDI